MSPDKTQLATTLAQRPNRPTTYPDEVGTNPAPDDITAHVETMTGAHAIIRTLEELGVEVVFGLPGGAILTTYDAINEATRFRHILVRHEQGAGHAASGYATATGKVGVIMATSGPGATNLVTSIADAAMDSVPIVAITGQVGASMIGTDAFQEADIVGITMPITKHSYLVTNAADIPRVLAEAFHIASTGRPGPVLVDITKTAMTATMDFSWPQELILPGYTVQSKPRDEQLEQTVNLLQQAHRPVLYVGGGTVRSGASAEVTELADLTGAPVVTTLMALGAVPTSHPHNLGMPGMHGTVAAVAALQHSDLIIALGTRFDDRVTGDLDTFAPHAKVVHVDIDPAEIGKNRHADVPIVGDVAEVVHGLNTELRRSHEHARIPDLSQWWQELNDLRGHYPTHYESQDTGREPDGVLSPQYVIERISKLSAPDTIFASGVGQHQMWAAQLVDFEHPRTWVNSGGLGTMGYAIPAAMGAKAGRPEADVWAIDGDGCFQMTNQELATCRLADLPIKVAIIDNATLGMPRQWQTLFYDKHYSQTDLEPEPGAEQRYVPDFVTLAQAYDCLALRVTRPEETDAAIETALAEQTRPVVIDFRVSKDAEVWPMVRAGVSDDEIRYRPGIAPLATPEESAP